MQIWAQLYRECKGMHSNAAENELLYLDLCLQKHICLSLIFLKGQPQIPVTWVLCVFSEMYTQSTI